MEVSLVCTIVQIFCCHQECLINGNYRFPIIFEWKTKLIDPINRQILISHPKYPVWVITLMCFNLISRMTIPGIIFCLIPCFFINVCCSSQLNLNVLVLSLVSTLGEPECVLPSRRKFPRIMPSMLQLRQCPEKAYKDHFDTRQYSSIFQSWKFTTPCESR